MACCPFLDSGDHLVIISLMEGWVREDRTGKKEGFAEGLGLLPSGYLRPVFLQGQIVKQDLSQEQVCLHRR